LENTEENCEMIWKIWKKSKLKCEMIWKIWKKGRSNSDKIWTISKKGKCNSKTNLLTQNGHYDLMHG
jgi:hypothetical protein